MLWDPYAEFQSEILPNGLTVYASNWPGRPWEAVGFLIHSGAEHDTAGFEGTAHFVEHLISRNTVIPYQDIKTFFENNGGKVNLGATGYPYTKYNFFSPKDKDVLEKAFFVFGNMLLSTKLEKDVEEQREVIVREFYQKNQNKHLSDVVKRGRQILYKDLCLGRSLSPLGSPELVKKITQRELQSYYDINYTPANMSIVGVGGMTLAELIDIISKSPFSVQKKGGRVLLPCGTTTNNPLVENRYIFDATKGGLGNLEAGSYESAAILPGITKYGAPRILEMMLSKILFQEIREKRAWTYNTYSESHYFQSFYSFSIICKALGCEALAGIEEAIDSCVASVEDREDLFMQTKQRILADMVDLDGRSVCNGAIGDLADYQKIISLSEDKQRVNLVTMDDIRELVQRLQPERRWTLIIRP